VLEEIVAAVGCKDFTKIFSEGSQNSKLPLQLPSHWFSSGKVDGGASVAAEGGATHPASSDTFSYSASASPSTSMARVPAIDEGAGAGAEAEAVRKRKRTDAGEVTSEEKVDKKQSSAHPVNSLQAIVKIRSLLGDYTDEDEEEDDKDDTVNGKSDRDDTIEGDANASAGARSEQQSWSKVDFASFAAQSNRSDISQVVSNRLIQADNSKLTNVVSCEIKLHNFHAVKVGFSRKMASKRAAAEIIGKKPFEFYENLLKVCNCKSVES
jgi:hypothetical protein